MGRKRLYTDVMVNVSGVVPKEISEKIGKTACNGRSTSNVVRLILESHFRKGNYGTLEMCARLEVDIKKLKTENLALSEKLKGVQRAISGGMVKN